jgi:hypothetical protein
VQQKYLKATAKAITLTIIETMIRIETGETSDTMIVVLPLIISQAFRSTHEIRRLPCARQTCKIMLYGLTFMSLKRILILSPNIPLRPSFSNILIMCTFLNLNNKNDDDEIYDGDDDDDKK